MDRRRVGKWISLLGAAVLAMMMTACGSDGKPAPVAVNPEVDVCAHCNMAVPDNEHATEMILADGTVLKFDDIGCMIKHEAENGLDIAAAYVRDAHSKAWVDLEAATFFYEKSIETPMGYGVLSFQDAADAEAMLQTYPNGVIMSLTELRNHHWERDMEHMPGHMMNGQENQLEHPNGHGQQEEMTHEHVEPQEKAE